MAIAFKCGSCDKAYKVDDKFAGKRVKCKACGAAMDVPAKVKQTKAKAAVASETKQAKAKTAGAKKSSKKPAAKVAPKKVAAAAPANDAFGLDAISQEEDLFGGEKPVRTKANPLGNHVVADPGFADVDMAAIEAQLNPDDSPKFSANPELEYAPKREEKKVEVAAKPKGEWKKPGLLTIAVGFLVAVLGFIVGFFVPIVMMLGGLAMIGLGACVAMWATIWGMMICYKNHKDKFIWYFLFPIYRIIYLFKNWDLMKGQFLVICASVLYYVLGFVLIVAAGLIHGSAGQL